LFITTVVVAVAMYSTIKLVFYDSQVKSKIMKCKKVVVVNAEKRSSRFLREKVFRLINKWVT
jgi:hypothetical protein